jgi:hypothetical protein
MIDDSLPVFWMSDEPVSKDTVRTAVHNALAEDRVARDKERSMRGASLAVAALLCPVLAWSAAHGVTPLVRGGYAFMAIGTAILITAEWMYLTWSREALPGPVDARAQLQKSAFLLARQAHLLRTAPLWCIPVFVGAALIGAWVFQERSHSESYFLFAVFGAVWLLTGFVGRSQGAKLDAQRLRLERFLGDL